MGKVLGREGTRSLCLRRERDKEERKGKRTGRRVAGFWGGEEEAAVT